MNYETALKLKLVGLWQRRGGGAEYYISPSCVISCSDIGLLREGNGMQWDMTSAVFKPELEDLLTHLGNELESIRAMYNASESDRQWAAYSKSEVPTISFGATIPMAIANLIVSLHEKNDSPRLQPTGRIED